MAINTFDSGKNTNKYDEVVSTGEHEDVQSTFLKELADKVDELVNKINTHISEIATNTAKTGISTSQASAITANTAKTSMALGTSGSTALAGDTNIVTMGSSTTIAFGDMITTSGKKIFLAPNIIIAAGVGSFEPRKFPTKSAEKFDGTSVLYSIKDKTIFKDKSVAIFGGGDSALDWAIELSNISKVSLIHRREEFRGAPSSVQKIKELSEKNIINLFTKYSIKDVKGNESLEEIEIKSEEGESKILKADYVLGFFGLIMQLGPIAEWGLNLDKKAIPVNTENFETNKKGIFAIGDICTYPGKLKLILSGFHEGALAARGCFKYARPDEKYRFEFTTASNTIKDRLGVK